MSNCRTITIGVAALGGVALWIVLALGARGWFSSLLIAALLAVAAALIVMALVCPGMDAEAEAASEPETPEREKAVTDAAVDPAPLSDAASADTGGRATRSESTLAKDEARLNDSAVLGDDTDATPGDETGSSTGDAPEKDGSGDLGEEVARTEALDRAAARPETVSPDMPDGVAADLRETPELLDAPRGEADDLKRLRGVGPKLEDQLNRLGVWHLDQIASWSEGEAAWIDDHLEGFKGRILRDDWIGQARELTGKP